MTAQDQSMILRALTELTSKVDAIARRIDSMPGLNRSRDESFLLVHGPESAPSRDATPPLDTEMARQAEHILRRRKLRGKHLPAEIFCEPGWEMLLDLVVHSHRDVKVSVSSLCQATDAPGTTALRYISLLEELGLIIRLPSEKDRRVTYIELTSKGRNQVRSFLLEVSHLEMIEPRGATFGPTIG